MVAVGLGQRDGPIDGELGFGQVHEGVGPLELDVEANVVLYGDEARQTEPDRLGKSTHVAVAEVQASHSIEALGALRLLIGRDDATVLVEPYDTKTLRVIDVVTEHGDAARGLELLHGAAQIVCQPDTE